MDREKFNYLLVVANLSKKEFSKIFDMRYSSVNNWGSSQQFPKWVESWLENYIDKKKFENIKEIIKEDLK